MGEGITDHKPTRAPKKKKRRSKYARNPRTKQNQKSGVSYERYADAIAGGAVTLELSQSDAILHRMKTKGQARKVSKASLISALEKSHDESISHREEAEAAARALQSVEERNRRLHQKNQDLADSVRSARVEVREHKSARKRSDVLADDMQKQLELMRDSFNEELEKRVVAVEAEEKVRSRVRRCCS